MTKTLIVLESPHKMAAVKAAAKNCGLRVRTCATGGHLYAYSAKLFPLGIDSAFDEPGRSASDNKLAFLRRDIDRSDRVVLATDADREGHAIAADVAALCKGKPTFRLALSAIDAKSFKTAWDAMVPFDDEQISMAAPAKVRRVVDRLLGAAYSDPKTGVACGRVQSALLSLFEEPVVIGVLRLAAPASDGGNPFVAEIPIFNTDDLSQLHALSQVPLPSAATRAQCDQAMAFPWNYADGLAFLASRDGIGVQRAADSLQSFYELGEISYPRVTERMISSTTLFEVDKAARARALKLVGSVPVQNGDEAHEAIRPVDWDAIKVNLDTSCLSASHAFRIECARNLFKSGLNAHVEYAYTGHFPEWAAGYDFVRMSWGTLPWEEREKFPGVFLDMPDVATLKLMTSQDIGKPSTYALHVARFIDRGLIDDGCRLTDKGQMWLANTPSPFDKPSFCRAVEDRLDACRYGDEREMSDMMEFLAEWGIDSGKLMALLSTPQETAVSAPSDDGAHLAFEDEPIAFRM